MEQKHDVYLFISSSSGIYHDLSQEHVLGLIQIQPHEFIGLIYGIKNTGRECIGCN